eukprot:TRINITY_DN28846_c0_g1_i1.p1 TRINITY_DN28846_c0_g1~~TRINITY_DN28846_c0_g1_i1.p1  ORF type:complete len:106 (+),score=42.68 TRINITY_DN28846_c0_g1_i1:65-382(+)
MSTTLTSLAKPSFVNNKWRKPKLSARQLKAAMGSSESSQSLKPLRTARLESPKFKLRKADREKQARLDKIQNLLANQEKIEKDSRAKAMQGQKKEDDILTILGIK